MEVTDPSKHCNFITNYTATQYFEKRLSSDNDYEQVYTAVVSISQTAMVSGRPHYKTILS
jgi:hypothetical protein